MDLRLEKRNRACVWTHGCRLNQSESQRIRDQLEAAGYEIVPFGEAADLGIVNTCAVTREAEAKCRQSIRAFLQRNPGAFMAAAGCYSQLKAQALAGIEGVDLILGHENKLQVLGYVRPHKNKSPQVVLEPLEQKPFAMPFEGGAPIRKRANLKIQDGCDFFCAYCVIPFARGRSRSRDWGNVLAEARSLAGRGARELVLTGINLGLYQCRGRNLTDLADALNDIPGLARLRLSSIEMTAVPDGILDRMADPGHALVPHLHIPLQSGSDKILRLMRRKYSVSEYASFIRQAHESVPDLCLGTDLMTGFPGEAEEDFEATCRVFEENPFAYNHVFPYSEREGTLAAKRTDGAAPVPVPERRRRAASLRELGARKRAGFHQAHDGREINVLFENRKNGVWPGYTPNYIRVHCRSEHDLANRRARVRLTAPQDTFAAGEIIRLLD